jgi:hypothetical protein
MPWQISRLVRARSGTTSKASSRCPPLAIVCREISGEGLSWGTRGTQPSTRSLSRSRRPIPLTTTPKIDCRVSLTAPPATPHAVCGADRPHRSCWCPIHSGSLAEWVGDHQTLCERSASGCRTAAAKCISSRSPPATPRSIPSPASCSPASRRTPASPAHPPPHSPERPLPACADWSANKLKEELQ